MLVIAVCAILWVAVSFTKSKSSSPPSSSSSAKPSTTAQTGTSQTAPPSPDFFSSLASLHSMTPASIASLPPPTSSLPSPTPAAEYINSNWPVSKEFKPSEFVNFVQDPLEEEAKDVVLSVMYPKGQYTNGEEGGTGFSLNVFGEGKDRAMISYQVGFEENFDFVKGGKMPGVFGGSSAGKCGGGRPSEACFSARFMWREKGEGEVYTYIPLYDGQCDETKANASSVTCHGDFGQSYNRGSFTFEAGKYNTLTEIAILNSNPSTENTEANGYLAVYDGETLAFERSDLVWRTNSSVFFSSVMAQTFFGGSTEDYASTVTTHSYFKNWKFFEGEQASTTEGKEVVAKIGGE
ncbi:uncharacterized protein JCM6883_007500 [Sporobolomyces salmoneus]|uniref:uncharacterized protein n=1 Tax=Sporobolomyces salmoneus TaxID=183962 RepID=UPI00316B052E